MGTVVGGALAIGVALLGSPAAGGSPVPRHRHARDRRVGDLLLPVVLDAGARRALGALVRGARTGSTCSRRRTTRREASTRRRARRSSRRRCARSQRPASDTVDRLLVGLGVARGSMRLPLVAAAASAQGLDVAVHLEPFRGRTPESTAEANRGLHAKGVHGLLRLRRGPRPGCGLGGGARAARGRARLRAHDISSDARRRAGFDGLYTYDVATWNGHARSARICTQAHRAGLLCAPSVGPGYDARLATPDEMVRPRLYRSDLRPDVAGGRPRERGRRDDHELQRVAGRDADRAGANPGRAARATRERGGSAGTPRSARTSTRRRGWTARFRASLAQ